MIYQSRKTDIGVEDKCQKEEPRKLCLLTGLNTEAFTMTTQNILDSCP